MRRHVPFIFLCAIWIFHSSVKAEEIKIPALETIDYIYVLGPFDIPDGPYKNNVEPHADSDGFQDRPRIKTWEKGAKVSLSPADERSYGEAAEQVLEMLGTNYHTVDSYTWNHELHRVGGGHKGGIVLLDGTNIGWAYETGGMGYFDFDYDPITEKVAYWKPLLADKEAPRQKGRIYRVHNCD